MVLNFSLPFLIVSVPSIIFASYILTLSPSIAGGDSGEIVAEGCSLGTAHPPGYPLLTMLIYAIKSWVNYGTVAYRINALSAALTSFAAGCIGVIVYFAQDRAQPTPVHASSILLSMGMFAFSPLIWQYAVTAEVFPLNTALAAFIVLLVVWFAKSRSISLARIGALVCGLALCNQHTIILYEVPLILWMLFLLRRLLQRHPGELVKISSLFLLGLCPYAYLPLAANLKPEPGSWGHVTSFSGFLHHFLRKDYGTFQLFSGAAGKQSQGLWERNLAFLTDFSKDQSLGVGAVLVLVAVVTWRHLHIDISPEDPQSVFNKGLPPAQTMSEKKKGGGREGKKIASTAAAAGSNKPTDQLANDWANYKALIDPRECSWTPTVLLATQLFYFGVFHYLANLPLDNPLFFGINQRFWMQPNVLMFVWVGVGYQAVERALQRLITPTKDGKLPTGDQEPTSSILFRQVSLLVAGLLVGWQYHSNFQMSDQREAFFFQHYATALLDPLPINATLLVNYDQQWTSVRYLQRCEGYRPDVTTINLSMMTYQWFQHKHEMYPHLVFPGTHHGAASPRRDLSTFTLFQFLESNTEVPVFLSGKMSHPDPQFDEHYEAVPVGLASRLMPKARLPSASQYRESTEQALKRVWSLLSPLPVEQKYSEVTWEWTIGRDFKDRLSDTAAYALDSAIKVAGSDPRPLVYAMYLLEAAVLLDSENSHAPATLLCKNAGLAHLHLVQNKLLPLDSLELPGEDVFGIVDRIKWPTGTDWKSWCSDRFVSLWGAFISRTDARHDPQYEAIKKMYEMATQGAAAGSANGQHSGSSATVASAAASASSGDASRSSSSSSSSSRASTKKSSKNKKSKTKSGAADSL